MFGITQSNAFPDFDLDLPRRTKRSILHVDADAFFASVEQAIDPSLKGKPVIVGGGLKGRGIVSAASYEARKYGIHSAMPVFKAKKLCPHAVFVRGNFEVYAEFSKEIFTIMRKYTPDVEPSSIDEGYADLSGTEALHKMTPFKVAKQILQDIHSRLGITASGGLASSKIIAKIASSMNKPHKLTYIPFSRELDFLWKLPLEKMHGVGRSTLKLLNKKGFKLVGDFAALPLEKVFREFDAYGFFLWQCANGLDDRPVVTEPYDQKSISKVVTFEKDISDQRIALRTLRDLCIIVLFKLRRLGKQARVVCLKIRYEDFQTFTFRATLERPSNLDPDIYPVLKRLFKRRVCRCKKLRLVGCGVADFVGSYNLSIFEHEFKKKRTLTQAVDGLREKYGIDVMDYGV